MIMVERDYKSLQEEVDEQRKLIRVLRNKYKDAVEEIKDLGAEATNEREYLGTALMEMHREMTLYKAILHNAFSHDEIDRIVAKSRYNPDNKIWRVPHFMFRNNNMSILNGPRERSHDARMQERNATTLYFPKDNIIFSNDQNNASLPPAVPGSVTPVRQNTSSNWNNNKSGKKTLADFSNERNLASRAAEYYIGVPSEQPPKFNIVKKLTSTASGVRLNPIQMGRDTTDSSSESNRKSPKKEANVYVTQPTKKIQKKKNKPLDLADDLSSSDELVHKTKKVKEKTKQKVKIKSKKLFSRGKPGKKLKVHRAGET
jgi:TPP-dependent 2-oxoacid decarboxylase